MMTRINNNDNDDDDDNNECLARIFGFLAVTVKAFVPKANNTAKSINWLWFTLGE